MTSRPLLLSFCSLPVATTSPLLYLSLPTEAGEEPVFAPVSLDPRTLTDSATGLVMSGDRIFTICSSERGFFVAVVSARDLRPVAQQLIPQVRDPHSICVSGNTIYIVSTGTDEVLALDISGDTFVQPRVVWTASTTGRDTHHINSIVEVAGDLLVSAFGPKSDSSWNSATDGYIHNISRDVRVLGGIYQPHTISVRNQKIYYCESRRRLFCSFDGPLFALDGYSRGVTWLSDDLVVVGTSILRAVSKTSGLPVNPPDPGSPQDHCGITLFDLTRHCELLKIDLAWFGPETYDLLLLDQVLDPLQLAVSAQLAERESIDDLRSRAAQQEAAQQALTRDVRQRDEALSATTRQLEAKDRALQAAWQEMTSITSSPTWTFLLLLRRLRLLLAPPGSWRERAPLQWLRSQLTGRGADRDAIEKSSRHD